MSRTERQILKAGLKFFPKVFMVVIEMKKTWCDGNPSEISLLSDAANTKKNIRDWTII